MPRPNSSLSSFEWIKYSDFYRTGNTGKHNPVCTVVAEAVEAGVRGALVYAELAVGTGEALDTVAAET